MTQPRSDLRIAVVGAGLIGRRHVELVKDLAVLDAIIDPAPESPTLASAQGCRWSEDLAAYLTDEKPDGIIIATPNQLHLDHGLLAVEAGVPMLIEKPITDTAASATRLKDAAENAGVPILVGHHRRHNPLIRAAKAAVEAGRLGTIATVQAQFWLVKPDEYYDADWRRQEGAGPVFINLIHDIDLLRYLVGEIIEVQAAEASHARGFAVEDTAAVILRFESGALGTVSVSDTVSAPWSWEMTSGENPIYPKTDCSAYMLGGTKASLSIPDLTLWTHPTRPSWWEPIESETLSYAPADPLIHQLRHFLDIIDGSAEPIVTAEDGRNNIRVLEAIKAAARHGGRDVLA